MFKMDNCNNDKKFVNDLHVSTLFTIKLGLYKRAKCWSTSTSPEGSRGRGSWITFGTQITVKTTRKYMIFGQHRTILNIVLVWHFTNCLSFVFGI